MDFLSAAVLFGLLAVGLSHEHGTHQHNTHQHSTHEHGTYEHRTHEHRTPAELDIEVPEITPDFFDEILQYFPCSDSSCEYSSVTPAEPEVVRPSPPTPSYHEFCKEISHGLHDVDEKYPKLKDLKSKLNTYFFTSMAEYERSPYKRKNIAVQVISELIRLLQMLQKRIQDCTVKVVPVVTISPVEEEIIAEEVGYPGFVGSVRGIPGVHYPNYTEVPITSFSCSDKKYVPGFYADLETGCQVFHVCYDHRRESFLCPTGTLFNQPLLACDYWYSSNCSLAPHYYDVNEEKEQVHISEKDHIDDLITTIIEQEKPVMPHIAVKSKDSLGIEAELDQIFKFLPVKAKVVEFPEKPVPKPLPILEPKFIKAAVAIPAMKVAAKAVPIVKAKIEDTIKAKVEDAIKTKVAAKIVPTVKVKAAGVAKAKLAAAAAAPVKAKVLAAAAPVVKAKIVATAPIFKAKALPIIKTAAAMDAKILAAKKAKKVAMISPLTKKALALGYMKLLKAKKLALMG